MSEPQNPQGQPQPQGQQPQQMQVHIREDKANTVYSNVCRVGTTPEEIFIDFAINLQQQDAQGVSLMDVNTRVLMNFFAAKRLALALSQSVQRYEQAFGVLELDPRRRLRQQGT